MAIGAGIKKRAKLALVLSAVAFALFAAIFPYGANPALGNAQANNVTSQVRSAAGGGGDWTRDCDPGFVVTTLFLKPITLPRGFFFSDNYINSIQFSCQQIASTGLVLGTARSDMGSAGTNVLGVAQQTAECGFSGAGVVIGARVFNNAAGYASGFQLICRNMPDSLESTEYFRPLVGTGSGWVEDVRCPTGTVARGLFLGTGSLVDRVGFRCGSITGATQTVSFGGLSNRTLGDPNFTVAASRTGAGTLGFSSSTGNICSISGTTVSILAPGTCTIAATAASTDNYAQASQAQSFTVNSLPPPTFGTRTPTLNGFTFWITNYQSHLTWTGSATNGGSVAISNTGFVTVTGLAPGASANVTINNHPTVSATTAGSTIALCNTTTSSQGGFTTVRITNVGDCNWVTPASISSIQVAVVAGGGGGGFAVLGGGGGAGEVLVTGAAQLTGSPLARTVTNSSGVATSPGASNLISIGAGGISGAPPGATAADVNWGMNGENSNFGGNGERSGFGSIFADGGGGGGGLNRQNGAAGGSGGGGARDALGGGADTSVPQGWTSFTNVGQTAGPDGRGGGGGAGSAGTSAGGGVGITIWDIRLAGGGGGYQRLGSERNANDSVLGGNGRINSANFLFPYAGTPPNYTSAGVNGTGTGGGAGAPGGSGVVLIRYAEIFTVTYNANGATSGLVPAIQQRDAHGPVTIRSNTGTLARTGFTFGGWRTVADGSSGASYSVSQTVNVTSNLNLFALWVGNPNTVSFRANFPSPPSDSTQVIISGVPTSLSANTFNRPGYALSSWNTLANGSGTSYSDSQTVNIVGPLTLFAQWALEIYTVTFDYNGATGGNSRAGSSYNVEGVVVTLPIPTKTGHRFEGWYEESNFSGSVLGETYTTLQTRTIYAKWSPVTYTILFEYNGATSQDSTSSASYTTGASGLSLPAPLKTGHTFAGWFTSSNLVGSAVSVPFITAVNQTLYAKWSAINYTISYSSAINVGGNTISATAGTAPVDANNYNIGNVAVVLANSGGLARAGYEFAGWVTSLDGTGSALNSGDSITFAAANVVLYPKWTPGQYSISYNVNGATGTAARSSDSYTTLGSSVTLPGVGSMVRNGYSFGGWSTTVNGSALSNANFTTTQNVILYAVWTLTDFAVTFDLSGGAGGSVPTTLTANIEQTITMPGIGSVTKTGHWFSGWNTQQNGLGVSYGASQSLKMPLGGAALFAVWVPDQYRISYNANGGNGGPVLVGSFDEATFGQPYTIRDRGNLARAGYIFSHWSTDVAGTGAKYTNALNVVDALQVFTPSSNTTFYAQWNAIPYTFTFDPNGGSISPPSQSKTIGQLLTLPDPGFRTGYSFAGWSEGGTNYQAQTNYQVGASAATFVAAWIPNVYRVSFDWQGAIGTPSAMQNYTFGTGGVTLPSIGDRVRDGYSFSGWAPVANGTPVPSFEPTSDSTLYAVWVDGNFTLNFNAQGGTISSAVVPVGRGTSTPLPNAVRTGFVLQGWFTDPTTGVKVGDAGSAFTPLASQTLHARWIQRSLFGVDLASLESGIELTASTGSSLDTTITHLASSSSARVQVPAGSLPNGTKINIRYFKDTLRQSDLIPGENNYLFSVLVSWLLGTGSTATVPDTDPSKPITVTLTNSSIKAGASIFMLIGNQVTPMGTATQDGSVTVQLFEDPELVVAQTRPGAPTSVSAVAADGAVSLSWSAPVNNGGAQINSYTVTATPGGAICVTSNLSCTISGLTNGTSYTFTVTAQNSVGSSAASTPTPGITPAPESFVVTFDSNGGSAVGNGNLLAGGAITQPANPTRSGFDFVGWSTTRDSAQTRVTFPFTPAQNAPITLYGLWQVAPPVSATQRPTSSQGGSNPAAPSGLKVVSPNTVSVNDNLVLEGSNFAQVTLVRVGGVEASFFINPEGRITIRIPANAPEGLLDLEFVGPFGSLTLKDAVLIKQTVVAPVALDRRVTIGTFLGRAAVYTKNHEGRRLSIRVGKKWFVIDPLKTNYTIHLTRVTKGKTITVMTYLDRKIVKVQQIKIR